MTVKGLPPLPLLAGFCPILTSELWVHLFCLRLRQLSPDEFQECDCKQTKPYPTVHIDDGLICCFLVFFKKIKENFTLSFVVLHILIPVTNMSQYKKYSLSKHWWGLTDGMLFIHFCA